MIATSFGIALMISISMFGKVSGGHLNPAVTCGLFSAGLIPAPKAILYIIAQCCGACAGAAFANAVTPGSLIGYNRVNSNITPGTAFLAEALMTFVLVYTVFTAGVDRDNLGYNPGFTALYVGFSVWALHISGITIDGTSINPARSFGAAAVSGEWADQWVFWFGPILGGLAASLVFNLFEKVKAKTKTA
jgi:MIP family channel proteins